MQQLQQLADQLGYTPEKVAAAMAVDKSVSLGTDTTQSGEDQQLARWARNRIVSSTLE